MFYLAVAIAAIIYAIEVKYQEMKKIRVNIAKTPSTEELHVDIRLNVEHYHSLKYASLYQCIIENCENAEQQLGDKYDGHRIDKIIESIILNYYAQREAEHGELDDKNIYR
jgi:hypothetical protein